MNGAISPSHRQMDVLRYVAGYQRRYGGVSPTVQEIAEALGFATKTSAWRLLIGLEERGLIRRPAGRVRAIELLVPVPLPEIDGTPLYFVPAPNFADRSRPHAA